MTESLPVLRQGDGMDPDDPLRPFVERLQHRLIAHRYKLSADGEFWTLTDTAVRSFQRDEKTLKVDGVVGGLTWTALEDRPEDDENWGWGPRERPEAPSAPERPDFSPLSGNAGRHTVFGSFRYAPSPTPINPEAIRFLDEWPERNLVTINVPQLKLIPGIIWQGRRVGQGPKSGNVRVHRLIATQMQELWQAWEDHGVMDSVITWAGMWSPRFILGSRSVLSNHAFATAFDINAPWNPLGREPAAAGKKGCVWKLVELAHEFGFYWGGHFRRGDGMHFEAAVIL